MPLDVNKCRKSQQKTFSRRTTDQLYEIFKISWILSENLHMGRVAAKFVPHLLTDEHGKRRLQVGFKLSNQHQENKDPMASIAN